MNGYNRKCSKCSNDLLRFLRGYDGVCSSECDFQGHFFKEYRRMVFPVGRYRYLVVYDCSCVGDVRRQFELGFWGYAYLGEVLA